ncbi:hypothetical protein CSUI_002468 [Cystoisospora suis]|uniref:Uncharacterized protein n=1 Tax=Cystoisospora suis TaxID=483139 RepID=A0A2C6L9B8_9APIC|nr:hypothetical protein CSUI_002468 [Cystoisospora suis]
MSAWDVHRSLCIILTCARVGTRHFHSLPSVFCTHREIRDFRLSSNGDIKPTFIYLSISMVPSSALLVGRLGLAWSFSFHFSSTGMKISIQ